MTVARGRPGDPGPGARPPAPASSGGQPAIPDAGGSRVLLVEDEPGLLRALLINLRARQYEVLTASAGRDALALAARRPPDAVILDLGLPDIDGTEVIVELRRWSRAPIIVLSGRASPGDKIGALDVGADDYVTKPFSMAELLARLRAVLRRDDSQPHGAASAIVGHSVIDLAAHTVTHRTAQPDPAGPGGDAGETDAEETIRLTPTEWRILETLVRRPGQLVSSRQMLTEIWGPGYEPRTNYLRFHMARLRRKLEDDPARPRHLLTEPGMGYRYQP
jgi:two-component system KDP operon response regulator KdpE